MTRPRWQRVALPMLPALLLASLPSQASDQEPRFEVCVLGTLHAPWQFRSAHFTPGHIRAALEKIRPDVVGVESNPQWFAAGRFHVVTYEAQGIAVPFARQHGLPVYGIDWMDSESWEARVAEERRRSVQMLTAAARRGPLPRAMFGHQQPALLSRLRAYFFQEDFDFARMNGVGSDDYAKKWLRGDLASEEFGGRRNRKIAARCQEVMRKHPGKRLVVVIGAGHKAVLDVLFGRMQGVRVLRLGREIPAPTQEEAESAWTDDDLATALGHNLDGERSCFHRELVDLPHVRSLLERFQRAADRKAHAHYFAARLALLTGDLDQAAESLAEASKVTRPADARLHTFPMEHWRMVYNFSQAVCIARAELALARGRHEEAARLLADLGSTIQVPRLPPGVQSAPEVIKVLPVKTGWTTNSPAMEITEGAGPLTVTLRKKPARGLSALVCKVKNLSSKGPLRVAVHVDGSHPSRGILEVYEATDASMHMLGRRTFGVGAGLSVASADFTTRHVDRPVFVFVYFDGGVGTRYRLHRAEIQKVPDAKVPATWRARFLAREYPRTLLAHRTPR